MKLILAIIVCSATGVFDLLAQTAGTPLPLITPPTKPADTADGFSGVVTGVTTEAITLKTEAANPLSFALGKTVRYVDKAGKEIQSDRIKPGARVRVFFEGNEDTRTATRVILEE